MTIDVRMKLFFEYRYLIYDELKKYSPEKYDIEELFDAGVRGLDKAIELMEENNIDFKPFALFYIKSEINKYLQDNM